MGRSKLFVGSLPPDITQEEMKMVFNTYGVTEDIHIMSGKSTSGQGCAFVVYETAEAAQSCINALNNIYNFRVGSGSAISVSWAKQGATAAPAAPAMTFGAVAPPVSLMNAAPAASFVLPGLSPAAATGGLFQALAPGAAPELSAAIGGLAGLPGLAGLAGAAGMPPLPPLPAAPGGTQRTKLFVGNLPKDVKPDAIKHVFGHYGMVINVHIMAGKSKSGQSCAFVEYNSLAEAETAMATLHDKYEISPGEGCIMVKMSQNGSNPHCGGVRWAPY